MIMKKENDICPTCESCQDMFEDNIERLVENVEGYTLRDHIEKKEELKEAFKNEK